EDQREPVGLDAQDHGTRPLPWLLRDEARLDVLAAQEGEHEVADLVLPNGRQQRGPQSQSAGSHRDVERAAADVGREARYVLERRTYVVGVEVDGAAAHRNEVVRGARVAVLRHGAVFGAEGLKRLRLRLGRV